MVSPDSFGPALAALLSILPGAKTGAITGASASGHSVTKAANPNPGFQITNLVSHSNGTANNTVFFHVVDPDQYANNASTDCKVSWKPSDPAPSAYILCRNGTFEWQFGDPEGVVSGYSNASLFGITVSHSYVDPKLGPPPDNVDQSFGRTTFNSTNLNCNTNKTGFNCSQKPGVVVQAPIFAEVA